MRRRLRGLIAAADAYPPFRVDVAILFGEELVQRGHRFDWLLSAVDGGGDAGEWPLWEGRAWVGSSQRKRSIVGKIGAALHDLGHDFGILRRSRRGEYDFIQVKDKFFAALVAYIAARAVGVPFFFWLSFPFPEAMIYRARAGISPHPRIDLVRGYLLKAFLYRFILKAADHVFVQSAQMKADVSAEGIPAEKLTPVPMGVSLRRLSELGLDGRPGAARGKDVVYLGDLGRTRRIDFLIRVFSLVVREQPTARLHLIGGAHREEDIVELKRLAGELELGEAIEFAGRLPIEQAWSRAAQAAVCVSPLYPSPIFRPASPTKVVEYMAIGRPVVVNDHPEQRQLVEASGGGLCVRFDEAEFATAIVELLRDPDTAEAMGARGRAYIEQNRDYGVIAEMVEAEYLRLCGQPPVHA